MLEEPTSLGGVAYRWDRATWFRSGLGAPLRYFFFSLRDTDKNIDARKILVRFEFRKVLKTYKYQKQGFSVLRSYKPIKEDSWKIPIKHYKTCK